MKSGPATPGEPWYLPLLTPARLPTHTHTHTHKLFEKREAKKLKRFSKQKPSKVCHQGQNITVLAILERLELKTCSCRPIVLAGNTFQCSIAPPLWNSFCLPALEMLMKKQSKFCLHNLANIPVVLSERYIKKDSEF